MVTIFISFLFYSIIHSIDCANVLVVFNPLAFSHLLVANRTVNALRTFNHTFTYLHIPLHMHTKNLHGMINSTNIVYEDFFTNDESEGLLNDINAAFVRLKSKFQMIDNTVQYLLLLRNSAKTGKLCKLFQLDSFREILGRMKFDFVILDSFITPCIRRVADIVNAPYAETVTVSMYPRQTWEIGCPIPFSYVTSDIVPFSGWQTLTFNDRIENVIDVIVPNLLGYLVMYYYGTRYLPTGNFLTYSNRDSNVSAFLLNDHPYLLPTRPTLNSIHFTLRRLNFDENRGKINIEQFLDFDDNFSTHNYKGCIIVSMSTLSDDLPDVIVYSVLNTIIIMNDYYFVWKCNKVFPYVKNLKTANFIPLEFLLRKPQTKLIIAHGGRSTVHEAIVNAVPLIGIPSAGDHETVLKRAGRYSVAAKKLKDLLQDTIIPLDDAAQFTNKLITRHHQKYTKPVGHQYTIFCYFNFDTLLLVSLFGLILLCLIYTM